MNPAFRLLLLLVSSLFVAGAAAGGDAPLAARQPRDVSVHGEARVDDWFWLRERDNPAVRAHLLAEAAHTEAWFAPLQPLRQQLYQEMLARIEQSDQTVPVRQGRWWNSQRTLAGQQYPVLVRQRAVGPERRYDPQAPEQLLLDLNRLAEGRKFLKVQGVQASPDGRLLAYALDETGARDFRLQVRDIDGARDLPWRREGTAEGAPQWSADGRYLFYLTHNAAKRVHQLWRHAVRGSTPDRLVFEEKDELFNLQLSASADGRQLFLTSLSKDTSQVWRLDATRPTGVWRSVLPRRDGMQYFAEHHGGRLLLRVDDHKPNFRLVSLPLGARSLRAARELIAARPDQNLESLTVFRRHLVVGVRAGGNLGLRVLPLGSGAPRDIGFDEVIHRAQVEPGQNLEFDSDTLRFSYQSMTTPPSVIDHSLSRASSQVRKVQPVPGYDASRYASERVWAKAADGTRVPVSLLYAKARRGAGAQPLLLYGYGAYGIPSDARFDAALLSLLDRGVVFAVAHVRGGGDLGRGWYLDGKLARKMNSFTDFIACADALVREGWTRPAQLIASGGSAGGLLMGGVVNLRPELFKAVVMEVPFVDVINTMLDESLPLTTEEFIEWGNPKVEAQYRWMRAYSPYDNLNPGAYPAILALTALNDSQVPYWEPAKYVAKLRTLKTDANPLLFDINLDAGHGGASGRFDALEEQAKVYAFMLQQWGLATR